MCYLQTPKNGWASICLCMDTSSIIYMSTYGNIHSMMFAHQFGDMFLNVKMFHIPKHPQISAFFFKCVFAFFSWLFWARNRWFWGRWNSWGWRHKRPMSKQLVDRRLRGSSDMNSCKFMYINIIYKHIHIKLVCCVLLIWWHPKVKSKTWS